MWKCHISKDILQTARRSFLLLAGLQIYAVPWLTKIRAKMLVWKQCQKMSETTTDKLKTFDRAYLALDSYIPRLSMRKASKKQNITDD
jgi:hypothetical protein